MIIKTGGGGSKGGANLGDPSIRRQKRKKNRKWKGLRPDGASESKGKSRKNRGRSGKNCNKTKGV